MNQLQRKIIKKNKKDKLGPYVRLLLPSNKNPCTRLFVTGRSGSGKTHVAHIIIRDYLIDRVHRFYVICPSFETQECFEDIRQFVREGDAYVNASDEVFSEILEKISKDLLESPKSRFLLFIDDVSSDYSTNKGRKGTFAEISTTAPHIHLSIVALFQQAKSCSAALRNNTTNIIMFAPADKDAVECFEKEFNPHLYDKEKKKKYDALVFDLWDKCDFLFIHRPPRQPVQSYVNFDKLISIS